MSGAFGEQLSGEDWATRQADAADAGMRLARVWTGFLNNWEVAGIQSSEPTGHLPFLAQLASGSGLLANVGRGLTS